MASSSSSASDSQYCPRWKYDVFLSFRGEDTRKTFTGHLYEGLRNRGIYTFQDNKRLEEGDSISEELLQAIEESQVSIIVFSKNYATSSWCLNELAKIMECNEEDNGQTVIPVFYDVDPSEVRKQTKSFAEAFAQHESKYKDDVEGMQKVQRWRTSLTTAADLKGYDIRNEIESEKIQQIVDHISSKFCKGARSLSFLQDIVGINAHLEKLKSRLQIEINDVRVLGIWGIGGVGKTLIAKALFDTLSDQFKAACFLADVKENARNNQLHSLQNTLLSKLLRKKDDYVDNKHDGKSVIPSRLSSMKVLIVLDDIDHNDHLEFLACDVGWFGNGSRVIVTTRNRQLIKKDSAIYEVPTLPDHEAMQLFNQHAFKKEVPDESFKELSLAVVDHAKGLPLALKVWGSLLHKKALPQWRRTVDQIKRNCNSEIVEKLKISYDGLEPEEQKIFLDIACFFRGHKRTEVMQILESCDFGAEYGLDVLIDKSLVFISEGYGMEKIEMHDLIEDMGKYIVKMEKDSGKPSRIWNVKDFEDVMVDNTGTMAIEAIWFSYFEKEYFSKEAMKNMQRLRILCIKNMSGSQSENDGSIEYLSNNLCWFVWSGYPWKLLPPKLNPTRLVHLNLRSSSLHHLWSETKQLPFLRRLDLSRSKRLKKTPDFTGMPNLEHLDLSGCTSLEEIHHSLSCSRKLIGLTLDECVSLERFPYVNVESLKSMYLMWNKFPEFIGRMKPELKIMMRFTGIQEIPSSIIHLQAHLTELHLRGMNNLVSLPSSICKLKCLVKLDVSECIKLESLPEEIGSLEKLEELDASRTLISRPASSIVRLNKLKLLTFAKYNSKDRAYFVFPHANEGLLSLEELHLSYCNLIDGGLPEDIGSLSSLKKLNLRGNNFEYLPRSIAQLGALRFLSLSHCKKLKELPCFTGMPNLIILNLSYCNLTDGGLPEDIGCLHSLKWLYLSGNNFEYLPRSIAQHGALRFLSLSHCKKLKELPCFTGMPNLVILNLRDCNLTDGGLPEDIGCLHSLKKLYLSGNNFENLPRSIAQLGALESFSLSHCKKLKELPCFTGMPNLDILDLSDCNLTDGGLPEDIGCLHSLKKLYLSGNNFEHLPRSISQLSALRSLNLLDCKKLKELPCLTGMPNLDILDLSDCNLTDGGLPEAIGCLHSLKKLYLSGNNFENLPRSIAQLGNLESFSLSHCKKLKELPCFMGMPNLVTLNLSYCNLTDGGLPEDIGCLHFLKKLYLSGNNFENLPRSIAQLGALEYFSLSHCKKLKEFPCFTGMPNLVTLNLRDCNLTDGGLPEDIGCLNSLKKLYLSGNNFENLPRSIAQLGALESFSLSHCMKLKELPCFMGMPNLVTLNLSYCNLTDGGLPEGIGCLHSLKKLYLSGNNFENLPRSIAQLGALEYFSLSHCKKLKELPCFTGMPNLVTLNLRDCNLTDGGLPEDIGCLNSLKKLYLSGNNFENLPRSIAQLGALESFSLSHCMKLKELPCFTGMPNLVTLNLSYCNLTDGGLPEDIGCLHSLKKLYLSGNNFENLPRSIAQLGALESFSLSHCKKLKELPCFTGMPNLVTLNLRDCKLTDGGLPEDIGCLHSLKKLYLSGNNFENLPRSIAQLGALESFSLSHCKKLKELPCFMGMPNLVTLNLSYCNLTDGGLPEDIGCLHSLKMLYLSGNNFENLPRSIAQLGALESFSLSHCKKLKELPCFTGMPNLVTLNLRDCNLIDGGLLEDIGCLHSLKMLYLSGNNFENLPRSIAQLGALESFTLSHCNKLKELPCFTGMPNLVTLNLSYCNLTDGGLPEDIGCLHSLKKFYLSVNNFESLPRSIAQLGALESFTLSHCKKLNELPCLMGMPNLVTLNLSYCNLTDGGLPEDIGCLHSLKKLYLSGNNFENLPRSIAQLGALESFSLSHCKKLKEFPCFTGMPNLVTLNLRDCNLTDGGLPEDIGCLHSLKKLYLSGNNFENLPRSIAQLGALESFSLSHCKKLKELPCFTGMPNLVTLNLRDCNLTDGGLPEDIGCLHSLKKLYLSGNNFENLPRSIAQLGALESFSLSHCKKLKELPCFTGMPNLVTLNLRDCNLTDGGLPEDIGCLHSLKKLYLSVNNFESLPRSIAQLGALESFTLSHCKKLNELPCLMGMPNLVTLNLSYCNLTDGGLPEDIGCLHSLKKLYLSGNNFEHLPRSISQLSALRSLNLLDCNKLTQLPEFPQQLRTITAEWSNDSICNSLFQNISSLQHDISVSDSLSLRVFNCTAENIPSWFNHQGMDTSVSVNLPENWYVSDKVLGFAVCYSGKLIDITAHLIPLCDDGLSSMTQKFALSNRSFYDYDGINFFLVPLAGLWDASNANGKTPNDYKIISLVFGEKKAFGVRLLYKDEPELHIGIRRSRYEGVWSCCFPLLQLFPTRPGF